MKSVHQSKHFEDTKDILNVFSFKSSIKERGKAW
jgi:hypothetical protein